MISPEAKAKFDELLLQASEELCKNGRLTDADLAEIATRGLPRLVTSLPGTRLGVGIPCGPGRSTTEETLSCVANLAFNFGFQPVTVQSFEIANNREKLVDVFISSGFRYMLFLDSDTVIEGKGVWQLLDTMKRADAAMVAALVPMRYTGEYNAYFEDNGALRPVKREDLPTTLTHFPVSFCGLAAAVLDLDKIKNVQDENGFRFKRVGQGYKHYGEDIAFCEWLTKHGLDFYVDPKVSTIHCVQHRFGYAPPAPKEE